MITQLLTTQSKVQKYSSLAQKINADFLCDEGTKVVVPLEWGAVKIF